MELAAGVRLGPYQIVAPLGEGGMGEVYKARDTRLDRTVAIKVLPTEIANDRQARERFEREARAVGALNHPHICTLHDVGRHELDGDGGVVDFLVMELVEGETLAERLSHGPLPIDRALAYGSEIASALERAHRAGIVHRDIKPANIMVTKAGVKLLDFGLAKLKAPAGASTMSGLEGRSTAIDTAGGTILGTVPYMAPEQVEGKDADARADIWALGAVLYEMVTGARPFAGETPASVIGAILKDTPAPLASRQPLAPAPLEHVVERCLNKDPDRRWQNAGDVGRELDWIARLLTDPVSGVLSDASRARRTRPSPGVAVGLALALLAAGIAGALVSRRFVPAGAPPARNSLRFEVLPPPDATLSPSPTASLAQLALSPDGSQLAFVAARRGEPSRLWIRPLGRVESQVVPGTEGASFPFWSPDGRFVAFFATGKLKKVDVALGTPQTLADVAAGRGGAWSPSGVIVFGQSTQPLSQVSADGGPVTPATAFDPAHDAVWHYWPHFLPNGRRFLYLQRSIKPEYQGIYVASLDSPETTRLVAADVRGLFAAGHLLFVRDGLLFAQELDEQSLRLSGEPARVADGVGFYAAAFGYASIDISLNGVLAFGPALRTSSLVQTFDREGKARGPAVAGPFTSPRLARDQRTVAVSAREAGANADVWLIDLPRGIPSRVTTHSETDYFPAWMPDGRELLFASSRVPSRTGANAIYRAAVGGGTESPLAHGTDVRGFPDDVSLDGQFVLFHNLTQRGYDLGGMSLVSGEPPIEFLATPFNEVQGRFSPDGRWVAYASDESGRFEVYLRAWPSAAERLAVSVGGGMEPEWRRDGKELFYLSADRKIMAVPIAIDGRAPVPGSSQALFSVDVAEPVGPYSTHYAVSADGQRFVVTEDAPLPVPQTLTVFSDWTAALKK